MKYKIFILSFISLLIVSITANCQDLLKYKDVFELLISEGEYAAYPALKQHQQQDPNHVNTYYQLGIISQKFAKKYDPLTEYDYVKYFSYHANLYLNMAFKYLDDKEARKNKEYYHHVPVAEGKKKIELPDIQRDISERIVSVDSFTSNINRIRKNYYSCVNNYNKCLDLFLEINTKNSKLKDIYLIAGDTLLGKINLVSTHFDSVLFYFDQYKQSITDYPIAGYNQNYTLASIETYKLHGLTNSNFLNNDIEIWNYGEWVDNLSGIIEDDIKKLRQDIKRTGKELESLISVLNLTNDYSTNYESYNLDENLIYRIGKFDYKPLIIDLFMYQQAKIDYLIKSKDPANNPNDTIDTEILKRLKFMYEFVNKKLKIDEKANKLEENSIYYNVMKYKEYIEDNYSDIDGLHAFIEKEEKNNQDIVDDSYTLIKDDVIQRHLSEQESMDFISYKKSNIPLFTSPINFFNVRPDQYYTNQIEKTIVGDIYLSGFYSSENKNPIAFIALSDSSKNVKWLKKFDFSTDENPNLYNSCPLLSLTENGCIAVVNATDNRPDSTYILNKLIRFDYKGKEITNGNVGPKLMPRFMFFDPLNEKLLIAYKGIEPLDQTTELQELIIDYSDSTGFTLWTTSLELQGDIVDIIRSNENFVLVANFSNLVTSSQSIKVQSSNGKLTTNSFSAVIDNTGLIKEVEVYSSKQTYFVSDVFKINSEIINLLGFEINVPDFNYAKNPDVKLIYKLIDTKGKEVFSY